MRSVTKVSLLFSIIYYVNTYYDIPPRLFYPENTITAYQELKFSKVDLHFIYSEDLALISGLMKLNSKKLEDLETHLKTLSGDEDFLNLFKIVLDRSLGVLTIINRFKPHLPKQEIKDNKRCLFTTHMFRTELTGLEFVRKNFENVLNSLSNIDQELYTVFLASEKRAPLVTDLEQLYKYLEDLTNAVLRTDLYISELVGKSLEKTHLTAFTTVQDLCQIPRIADIEVTPYFCFIVEAGIACEASVAFGIKPTMVYTMQPIIFDTCHIRHKYYLEVETNSPRDQICLTETDSKFSCYLTNPGACTMAILAMDINRIRSECELNRKDLKFQLGLDTLIINNLGISERGYILQTLPQISIDQLSFPLIIKGGHYQLQLPELLPQIDFGQTMLVIRPQLNFERDLLCPSLLNIKTTSEIPALVIIIGLILVIFILITIGIIVYFKMIYKQSRVSRLRTLPTRRTRQGRRERRREENEMLSFLELLTTRT